VATSKAAEAMERHVVAVGYQAVKIRQERLVSSLSPLPVLGARFRRHVEYLVVGVRLLPVDVAHDPDVRGLQRAQAGLLVPLDVVAIL
jgi:hypothetical protein